MIVIFGGRLKSGKTTLANILIKKGFEKISFASSLKEIISSLYKIPLSELYDQNLKNKEFDKPFIYDKYKAEELSEIIKIDYNFYKKDIYFNSYREMLQYIGTDILREYDNDFHIKRTIQSLDPNKNYTCDDVRYPNELKALKKKGAVDIYLIRPNMFELSNHISETSLNWSNFNHHIINSKSLNKFEKDFIELFNSNFQSEEYSYPINRKAFLEANRKSAYLAGLLAANSKFFSKGERYIEVFKFQDEIFEYVTKQDYYNKPNNFYLYKIKDRIIIKDPYIIENLKFWNVKPEGNEVPDIIKNDDELLKCWTKGVFKD